MTDNKYIPYEDRPRVGTLILDCGIRMPNVVMPYDHVLSGVNVSHKKCVECDYFTKYSYGTNGYCNAVKLEVD